MRVETIPNAILAKHPEMEQVFEALAAYREGHEITTRCPTCACVLVVTDLPEVGARWVTCETGCISYREQYSPKPSQAA